VNRGRHASASAGTFYRDLVMMLVGILLVGAAVFLVLYLFAGNPEADAVSSTSSSPVTTTSVVDPTSTTDGATSTSSTVAVSTTTTVPVRPASEVRVVVLNSIGLAGAAGRMTQRLADAGSQTPQADDYEPEQDPSRIWYREGFAPEANAILELLPGALVEPLPETTLQEGSDIVVVLGTGYQE
jgi:hypothetical protein